MAWVRVDALSKSADATIYIYYGNPGLAPSARDAAGVWDTSYKGVWHLSEEQPGAGRPRVYKDATSNDNHGDDNVSATGKDGKIHRGQKFDDLNDFILVPHSPELNIAGDITISSWIKRAGTQNYGSILTKTNTKHWNYELLISSSSAALDKVMFWSDDTTPTMRHSIGGIVDTSWHHVAATRSGDTVTLYIDGAVSGTGSMDGAFGNNAYPLRIGDSGEDLSAVFHGYLDEVRLSSVARSADWIATGYNNQSDTSVGPNKFIKSLGPEE